MRGARGHAAQRAHRRSHRTWYVVTIIVISALARNDIRKVLIESDFYVLLFPDIKPFGYLEYYSIYFRQ